jgi:hypothetical protein
MKLLLGTMDVSQWEESVSVVELSDEGGHVRRFPPTVLLQPPSGELAGWFQAVNEVVLAYADHPDLEFLRLVPNATKVRILPPIKDVNGLRYLTRLKEVVFSRKVGRLDVLGELSSLEAVSFDGWPRGAESIFQLKRLSWVGLGGFGCRTLEGMSGWSSLQTLVLDWGKLEVLTGIPASVRELSLGFLRKLSSLEPLSHCGQLERLIIEGCKGIESLEGLEHCHGLRILSIYGVGGGIKSLEPLRGLTSLEHVVLSSIRGNDVASVDALYTLPNLTWLNTRRSIGVDAALVQRTAPQCEVRVAPG